MLLGEYAAVIRNEVERSLSQVAEDAGERLVDAALAARRLFVLGAGRSGLVMRAFAMRLMQMGLASFVVGETVTPPISNGDLLLIGSGSGETLGLVAAARRAKDLDARVGLLTIFPRSTIGELADLVVTIPASTPKVSGAPARSSMQPMGSLFEQSLLLLLDAIVLCLMERRGEDSSSMFARHANLE